MKWPNDVLISGYKVCGVLAELLPDARGVVIGAGLNVALDEHDLPTL
ncbi:biotin--[acetyl-CoA-carboxylase] ligase, partial [Rhizobium johnstonii]